MEKQTARQLHQLLSPLGSKSWYRATFFADKAGKLLHHFGISDTFKSSEEEITDVSRNKEASESLYLTEFNEEFFIGILFDAETEIDVVRDTLRSILEG